MSRLVDEPMSRRDVEIMRLLEAGRGKIVNSELLEALSHCRGEVPSPVKLA